jgi:hypothetical protein
MLISDLLHIAAEYSAKRVFPEAGSVYHGRLPCRVNDIVQSCLLSRRCCMSFSFAAKASVLLLFLGSTLYVHLRG